MSEVRESVSAPFKCLFFFCWGVRGSCFMSCLVLKSVGLQRASHLCEEKLWTHQTDRELCEDRHEADCTHSTRHGPLGEAERTKEVKLLRLAEAILLITIWSLFFPARLRALRAITLFRLYSVCHSQLTSNVGSLSLWQKRSCRCLFPAVSAVKICILIWQTIVCKFPHLSDVCKYL